jgi:hypothetical protein
VRLHLRTASYTCTYSHVRKVLATPDTFNPPSQPRQQNHTKVVSEYEMKHAKIKKMDIQGFSCTDSSTQLNLVLFMFTVLVSPDLIVLQASQEPLIKFQVH